MAGLQADRWVTGEEEAERELNLSTDPAAQIREQGERLDLIAFALSESYKLHFRTLAGAKAEDNTNCLLTSSRLSLLMVGCGWTCGGGRCWPLFSCRTLADLPDRAHCVERARDDLCRSSAVDVVGRVRLEQFGVREDDPELVVQAVEQESQLGRFTVVRRQLDCPVILPHLDCYQTASLGS